MADTIENATQRRSGNPLRPWIWAGAGAVLLLPAIAMLLQAPGVAWSAGDFVVMGLLLAIACGLYELGAWLGGAMAWRAAFGIAVFAGLSTVWVNLAVGMLGSEADPANLLFVGVLAIAALGSLVAAFRPAGMARAMLATALAQLGVAVFGLASGYRTAEVVLTACFALPWLASGFLFHRARGAAYTRPWHSDR